MAFMVRGRKKLSVSRIHEGRSAQADVARKTPAERIEMIWQLAVDAWAFKGEDVAQRRLQRDVLRVVRRGR